MGSQVPGKDSLPDTSTKDYTKLGSTVSLGSGKQFSYGFKAGNTACVSMSSIGKSEKGANFGNRGGSSSGPAQVKVSGGAKGGKKAKTPAKSGVKSASKAIAKGDKNAKQSVARVGKGSMKTPGGSASKVATPKLNASSFKKMANYLKQK